MVWLLVVRARRGSWMVVKGAHRGGLRRLHFVVIQGCRGRSLSLLVVDVGGGRVFSGCERLLPHVGSGWSHHAGCRARAHGSCVGCHSGYGRVLVGWWPHRPWRRGPCIQSERKMGKSHVITHLTQWMVTMACIVTIWTTWHLATSSPACSIVRCALSRWGGDVALPPRGWCRLLSSYMTRNGGGW